MEENDIKSNLNHHQSYTKEEASKAIDISFRRQSYTKEEASKAIDISFRRCFSTFCKA